MRESIYAKIDSLTRRFAAPSPWGRGTRENRPLILRSDWPRVAPTSTPRGIAFSQWCTPLKAILPTIHNAEWR